MGHATVIHTIRQQIKPAAARWADSALEGYLADLRTVIPTLSASLINSTPWSESTRTIASRIAGKGVEVSLSHFESVGTLIRAKCASSARLNRKAARAALICKGEGLGMAVKLKLFRYANEFAIA
jgi:hypothetical protein